MSGEGEEFYSPGAKHKSREVGGTIVRGLNTNGFEPSCIKRREHLESFERGSNVVRAGQWGA